MKKKTHKPYKINFSVIIPNFNGANFLSESLPHLLKAIQNCPQSKFEIILVDNGSTDDSLNILNKYFLESKIILLEKNYGFAYAINKGIQKSKYKYVCLLNNDLNINSNWFNKIFDAIKVNSQAACFCGTVLNKLGTEIESMGITFDKSGKCLQIKDETPLWGSTAALVVYSKKILKKIGNYDSSFFAYLEDVDVALRLNLLGYKTILIKDAISWHLGGGTSNQYRYLRQYYSFRNWFFIIIKDYPFEWIVNNFLSITIERLRNLSYLLLNCPIHLIPFLPLKAFFEIIYYTPYLLKKRRKFQKLLKSPYGV